MRPSYRLRKVVARSLILLVPALYGAMAQAQTTATRDLLLEVYVNGHDTEKVGSFRERDGHVFATADELRALGLAPTLPAGPDDLVDLGGLVSQPVAIDEREQTISLTVPIDALAVHRVEETRVAAPPIAVSPTGLLVNYDVTATAHSGSVDAYGFGTARIFSRFGTLQSDFSVSHDRSRVRAVRLNTTYSYSDPDRLRTYSVGDVLSGALPYSRSLRIGGAQISTNFALRPDLITYPIPAVSGGAAVPSTIDVFVDGIRQLSTRVDAGPFTIPQLPVVSGAGQVSVTVRDATGRQTVQTSSFYLSSALLQPGLSSYSAEAGAIRSGFGLSGNDYGPMVVSATGRRGVTSHLTLEGHFEGAGRSASATGGATAAVGKLAIMTTALGISRSSSGMGSQAYFALERTTRIYHVGLSRLTTSSHFRDLGTLVGDLPPRRVLQANGGMIFGRLGSLGLAYTDIVQRRSPRAFGANEIQMGLPLRTSLASATYSRELLGRAYLHVTGYSDLRRHNHAISAGISFRFGGHGSVSAAYESATRQTVLEAGRPAINPGDFGWRAYATQGANTRALGEIHYRGSQAELALGVDTYRGMTAVQAAAHGSVVMMGGSVFAATTITDGFAVVDTEGFGNVAVALNNRPVGKTGRSGKLLVPGLASYHPNTISIDPGDLPLDTRWERLDTRVSTTDRAGAVARFGVRTQHQALVTIALPDGRLLPIGSQVALQGSDTVTTSGYDGQVYFDNLQGQHRLRATLPDGTICETNVMVWDNRPQPITTNAICN